MSTLTTPSRPCRTKRAGLSALSGLLVAAAAFLVLPAASAVAGTHGWETADVTSASFQQPAVLSVDLSRSAVALSPAPEARLVPTHVDAVELSAADADVDSVGTVPSPVLVGGLLSLGVVAIVVRR